MPIASEHQQQLDEHGYIVIPEVLSETEIEAYRADCSFLKPMFSTSRNQ